MDAQPTPSAMHSAKRRQGFKLWRQKRQDSEWVVASTGLDSKDSKAAALPSGCLNSAYQNDRSLPDQARRAPSPAELSDQGLVVINMSFSVLSLTHPSNIIYHVRHGDSSMKSQAHSYLGKVLD